jgi:hypothetical protein
VNAVVSLLVFLAAASLAVDPTPGVKVELMPKDAAWVGQRVTLAVTLSTPDLFAGAPDFDLPSVPGAVVLPPAGSPIVGSDTIGGTTFTTQRHEFAVYAQRDGVVRVPAFAIRFESNTGFGKPIQKREVTTEPVSFTAKKPPGSGALGTVIAARNLKITDEWRPEPKAPRVGDAFMRTLTVSADDVPGMVFPSFRLDGVEGLVAYPKEPSIDDHTERGSLTGQRIEATTYVCEVAGTVAVPVRTLTWYDLDTNELKMATVPGRAFAIAPAPKPDPTPDRGAPALNARSGQWRDVVVIGSFLVLGGALAAWLWRRCARSYETWSGSEPADFARLRRACHSNDPHTAFVVLLHWLDRFGLMSLDELARRADDPELTAEIAGVANRVYVPHEAQSVEWSGDQLFARIALARRRLSVSTTRPDANSLPPLNPVRGRPTGSVGSMAKGNVAGVSIRG